MDPDVNIVKRQLTEEETLDLNYEPPYLRAKIASYEREVANLKADNAELTKSLYKAYDRIRELTESEKTISGDEKTW
jgi:hypothetical protein